ncbi:MAG: hypothetical protein CVV27_19460 [Candidatus Melainabacteria bacterium HGW-Melainabacteria-1]|nr:MAG: hypothetical protein CVV27_19460 [Candidatus Melainabacteria bacterium HGW-Melainabacteria-1]
MRFQALQQVFQPLECTGSPYDRGYAQGQAARKQMLLCFNAFFQSETFELLKPRWLPASLARHAALRSAQRSFAPVLRRQLPDAWALLEGLAAGAGVAQEQLLYFCISELLLAKVSLQLGGGTTLMIPPRFSSTEEPMLIRNFDHPYFLKSFNLVRKSRPDQGFASVDVTLVPSVGAHTGLNEAGVAISYNYGHGVAAASHRVPVSLKVQQALQSCESAAEVVRLFERGEQEGGAVLGVQDSRGEMYLIEVAAGKVQSKQIRDNLLIATNHYQLAEMVPGDIPVNAYYDFRHHLKELAGRRVRESSESRFDRLYELTGTRIQYHQSDLLDYFADHGESDAPCDNSICRHGEYYETTCSVMIKPLSREVSVSQGNPCEVPYQVYQWI